MSIQLSAYYMGKLNYEDYKMKIYTKGGDIGETSLLGGERVAKADQLIDLYGDVDELNSFIGCSIAELKGDKQFGEIVAFLSAIQVNLFMLGSLFACPVDKREKYKLKKFETGDIIKLEQAIDALSDKLPELKNFILPGGAKGAASLHLCRSVTRRVERKTVCIKLQQEDFLPVFTIPYLNRLSDYFFVLARYVNKLTHVDEIIVN